MANRITRGLGLFGRIQADQATIGGVSLPGSISGGNVFWVDGTNGSDSFDGRDKAHAKATIQAAITAAGKNDTIYIIPKEMAAGATDPVDYAETLTIGPTQGGLALIGLGGGMAQGNMPQVKKGSGAVALLKVQAPGVTVQNLGFNGAGSTGGGIVLEAEAGVKDAMGFIARGCHFKNLKSSGAAATGGAIYWTSNGASWQVRVENCHFYNCRAGVVLMGTGISVPQDVAIVGCEFMASAKATVDADLYLAGGDGITALLVADCYFGTVDVPAYATAPSAARYMDLTGCDNGLVTNCRFACVGKTFGAAGDAAKIPTTVRMAANYQEDAIITRT